MEKLCSRCGHIKVASAFYKRPDGGLHTWCKLCDHAFNKEYIKIYRKTDRAKELAAARNRRWQVKNPIRAWASHTRSAHRKMGFIVEVTTSEIIDLAASTVVCSICGVNLKWESGTYLRHNSPSLDRINNESVLHSDNIMIICHSCNSTKRDRTLSEFIEYCKMVASKKWENVI